MFAKLIKKALFIFKSTIKVLLLEEWFQPRMNED